MHAILELYVRGWEVVKEVNWVILGNLFDCIKQVQVEVIHHLFTDQLKVDLYLYHNL